MRVLSKPIVRIATIGIALGMTVMILAMAIVTGFQGEIREKVVGFGSHIQITNFGTSKRNGEPKLEIIQDFYPGLDTVAGVRHIQLFALKEGVIETKDNIQGVLVKGVAEDYDWDFITSKLIEGRVLNTAPEENKKEVLISKFLADRLQIEVGGKVPIYFQNSEGAMSQRNFELVGIFATDLRELDEEFVFAPISEIRKLNQWGLSAQLLWEGCRGDSVVLSARGFGRGSIDLKWSSDSLKGEGLSLSAQGAAMKFM